MKILVITSCTGEKIVDSDRQLTAEDFQKGAAHIAKREKELKDLLRTAGEIYSGDQHVKLMAGVDQARQSGHEIDLHVLSAGYGLIPEERKVAPYEITFATMKSKELRGWADTLHVPEDFRKIVSAPYDFGMILLGDNYLAACNLDETVKFGGPTLLFCGTGMAKKLPKMANVRVVPISNPEAKRFSCGLIGLKGELASRVLRGIAKPSAVKNILDPRFDVLKWLDMIEGVKKSKTNKSPVSSSMIDEQERQRFTFFTPRQNTRLRYFIPEWDDRVDPDYDFLNDGITPDRNPYVHDVYAHEIYPGPSYDGILVSKSVIEDNKTKKERIRSIGIHKHVRVPRSFPVMGDCGAFNYIDEEVPPYETEETIHFYESLDFDYGVSIDHLIIPAHLKKTVHALLYHNGREKRISCEEYNRLKKEGFPLARGKTFPRDIFENREHLATYEEDDLSEGKRRWNLTLKNAKDFISVHKKKGASFTPIAGCQGYSVESQIEMFRQQQDMGYAYIALGGLVRSKTMEILEILEGINRVRKPGVKIHLFGVARPEAITSFQKAGVDSIDSARFLRQAWLSATSNYYAGEIDRFSESLQPNVSQASVEGEEDVEEKWRYAAIRVPPLQREGSDSLTAKASKLVKEGWTLEQLRKEEKKSLKALREFDSGKLDLESALDSILAYDQLMGGDPKNEPHYRRVLEDKPWTKCPCAVCKSTGIDVIVFRRNNRNRRRGFHNTWWFYQFFSRATTLAASSEVK